MTWFIYIIECEDGSYYVGHSNDPIHRFDIHRLGSGAKHTSTHRPLRILYTEPYQDEAPAIRRERQLKGWSRTKKKALIDGNASLLKKLSRSKDHKKG